MAASSGKGWTLAALFGGKTRESGTAADGAAGEKASAAPRGPHCSSSPRTLPRGNTRSEERSPATRSLESFRRTLHGREPWWKEELYEEAATMAEEQREIASRRRAAAVAAEEEADRRAREVSSFLSSLRLPSPAFPDLSGLSTYAYVVFGGWYRLSL
eukprot:1450367-Rhodomonas_salina.2